MLDDRFLHEAVRVGRERLFFGLAADFAFLHFFYFVSFPKKVKHLKHLKQEKESI